MVMGSFAKDTSRIAFVAWTAHPTSPCLIFSYARCEVSLLSRFIFTAIIAGIVSGPWCVSYTQTTLTDEIYSLTMVLLMHTC